ncbi:hypothetical protein [Acaryochloris thomasi]|uniref:hypothetical protein n=1 Tax=Acaryochloris thomasi TaxID=2929456 RepID=UPI000DA665B4|nr:hypothetical protein [Acaryochloris thomasi]
MPTPIISKSPQRAKSSSPPRQSEQQRAQQHERPIRPYWLNMAIGSTLQYALEREAEWARG